MQRADGMEALVRHLDRFHPGWVQDYMARQGFEVPLQYPVRKFRVAVAALMVSESRQAGNVS